MNQNNIFTNVAFSDYNNCLIVQMQFLGIDGIKDLWMIHDVNDSSFFNFSVNYNKAVFPLSKIFHDLARLDILFIKLPSVVR